MCNLSETNTKYNIEQNLKILKKFYFHSAPCRTVQPSFRQVSQSHPILVLFLLHLGGVVLRKMQEQNQVKHCKFARSARLCLLYL